MPGFASSLPISQALALVRQRLEAGDPAGAEGALAPFFAAGLPGDPDILNAGAIVRLAQGRFAEAAQLCGLAVQLAPREAMFLFNHGRALAAQGDGAAAERALRAAVKRKPDFAEAWSELGALQLACGRPQDAEKSLRALLRAMPGHVAAKLMLGQALIEAGRPADAEGPLRRGLDEAGDAPMKAALHHRLGTALSRQRKDEDALAEYDKALNEDARDPALHYQLNDLLYRMGRDDRFLKSYDRAPAGRDLLLGKAHFLSHAKRGEEAHAIYRDLLARDACDRAAALGAANALTMMGRHAEASAAFDALIAQGAADADLLSCAAEPALLGGDPERALALCEQGLALAPHDQGCLALESVALRLMDDVRDEALNGYDTLVREFLLEPPEGFSSMADFNAELNAQLDPLHPAAREFIEQSLRGGTQTPGQLFDSALPLVAALRRRIDDAVARYIAELPDGEHHPFLSRRARDVRYAGSWSSRLRDKGFHVNHIHHQGWISSCYYVAVPDAVRDEQARQGWIKFGESSFDVPLKNPVRRAIQPQAGKLVLFPSYMWHGTIPFTDSAARTTIAFDVVPS